MTIFKDKKVTNIIIVSITLISLLELYFSYKIFNEYKGIYQIQIFIPLIFQPLYYKSLFRRQMNYFKLRIILTGLMSIILPLAIYFTLPTYTYNEGKQIIEQYVQSSENPVFIDFSKARDTVPISGKSKGLFLSHRDYYYGIKSNGDNKYLRVNPLTGRVIQVPENYWDFEE